MPPRSSSGERHPGDVIPRETTGSGSCQIALPDNGFGAQGHSAGFVVGFYEVRPTFKTTGDGMARPGPVGVLSFTPFSDP